MRKELWVDGVFAVEKAKSSTTIAEMQVVMSQVTGLAASALEKECDDAAVKKIQGVCDDGAKVGTGIADAHH